MLDSVHGLGQFSTYVGMTHDGDGMERIELNLPKESNQAFLDVFGPSSSSMAIVAIVKKTSLPYE